jgi:hypothetical protein
MNAAHLGCAHKQYQCVHWRECKSNVRRNAVNINQIRRKVKTHPVPSQKGKSRLHQSS